MSIMSKPITEHIIKCLAAFSITLPDAIVLNGFYGDIQNDSRSVVSGDIFCAIIGHEQDGRQYNKQAINQGAKLVIAECENESEHGDVFIELGAKDNKDNKGSEGVAIVKFYQLNQQLFTLTKAYYQQPQDNMTIIGITGTNGKTTTSQLLAQLLTQAGKACAIIGTNGAGSVDKLLSIENTTPGASELHQLFKRFNDEKFKYVSMEVSSHALSQKRVQAELFDIALFTNLSRDHLDYHGSMANYGDAKKQIFTGDNSQIAVLNFDDKQAKSWIANWPKQQTFWLYGREKEISSYQRFVTAESINLHSHGASFTLYSHLGRVDISSRLLGDFNIDNLLGAISVLLIQGVLLSDIPRFVIKVNAIAGRMEASSAESLATAVVDYAHTPDALEKALLACQKHCEGKLYVVFGCGGDRDKGKRALMAQAAEKYADYVVVTNDNPRSEDAYAIAQDIVAGFSNPTAKDITIILEREEAVLKTLAQAEAGDIVLLAGKGHEDYVIVAKRDDNGVVIGTQKLAYHERLVVEKFYQRHSTLNTLASEAKI